MMSDVEEVPRAGRDVRSATGRRIKNTQIGRETPGVASDCARGGIHNRLIARLRRSVLQ